MALAKPVEIRITGPEPGPGRQLCAACCMNYKAQFNAEFGEQVKMAEAGLAGPVLDMTALMPDARPPALSVALGIYTPLNNAMLPLCWTHLAGVKFTNLATGTALPDSPNGGLVRG